MLVSSFFAWLIYEDIETSDSSIQDKTSHLDSLLMMIAVISRIILDVLLLLKAVRFVSRLYIDDRFFFEANGQVDIEFIDDEKKIHAMSARFARLSNIDDTLLLAMFDRLGLICSFSNSCV